MELLKVCVPVLGLVCMIAGVLVLPWWLQHFAWFRCLENWLWYRRWMPCAHPVQRFRLYGPAMPANKEAEVWEFVCQACGTVFIRDTWKNWETEGVHVPWWTRVLRVLPLVKGS